MLILDDDKIKKALDKAARLPTLELPPATCRLAARLDAARCSGCVEGL